MTNEKELIPFGEAIDDLRETREATAYLKFQILPYMKSIIKWRFLPVWIPLWAAIAGFGAWAWIVTGIASFFFIKHCLSTLGCYTSVRSGELRIRAISDYLDENYPNEKD